MTLIIWLSGVVATCVQVRERRAHVVLVKTAPPGPAVTCGKEAAPRLGVAGLGDVQLVASQKVASLTPYRVTGS